jgi:hypothetical protein
LWARKAKTLIDEILGRDLSELDILVVMLDGIYLCDGLCSVAAIGIDRSGTKHVLGFRIGSSENAEVCRDLVGEDLITFFTLEVPSTLNRSLLSTNAIENAFLNLRRHIGRVWRWRSNTDQADRWVASGLYLSEKTFHRIPGCNDMDKLETALAKNGYSLEPSIEMTNT